MIKVQNLDKFDSAVQDWFEAVEEAAQDVAVGMAKQAFDQLLETSPQYSGDFVANWKISIDHPDTSFTMDAVMPGAHDYSGADGLKVFAPYQMKSSPAIGYAKSLASGRLDGFRLGQSIFLSNSAYHPDRAEGGYGVIDPYAWKIENGAIRLRPVNQGADHVVRRAAAYTLARNKNIDTPAALAAIRRFGS